MKLVALATLALGVANGAAEEFTWRGDVAPILRANCVSCHKPGKAKGGLDLTSYAAALKGGNSGAAVRPRDARGSPLVDAVGGAEPSMPKEGEPLSAAERNALARWIELGAKEGSVPAERRPPPPRAYAALPAVAAMAASPDGRLLAVAGKHEILLHKADGSGIVARLPGDSPRLESLAFSRDGALLAACGGAPSEFGELQIWDVANRRLRRSIRAGANSLLGVALSPNGRLAAAGGVDKLVRVFDVAEGRELARCDNHLDWVVGVAFANDGQRLATASWDKAAKLIDAASGKLVDDVNRPRDLLLCLARHPRDDLVATGGAEGKIRLFRIEPRGGRLSEGDDKENSFVREFEHMASPIHALAYAPDGALVACGGLSGEVRVFRTADGRRLSRIDGQHGPVFALAFVAGGQRLAVGGQEGRIRLYQAESGTSAGVFDAVPLAAQSLAPARTPKPQR